MLFVDIFFSGLLNPIRQNRFKFAIYILTAALCAYVLSYTFGENFDRSKVRLRGAPKERPKRQVPVQEDKQEEPFGNRPKIRTKNGHLVIESSLDKNIEFRTSGSRGTISINGHKIEQLLNVTKAFERLNTTSTGQLSSNTKSIDYESILGSIFRSSNKIKELDDGFKSVNDKIKDLNKKFQLMTKKLVKKLKDLDELTKKQEALINKFSRDDCFDSVTGQAVCKNGATCLDTFNGYKCLCPPNFEGTNCEKDVDECFKYKGTDLGCQNGARCINTIGSYRCECKGRFHGVHCTELEDNCALSSSKSLCGQGKCISLARNEQQSNQLGYDCICDQGWTKDGTNPACVIDVNECQPDSNSSLSYPCSQHPFVECTNLPGSFQCGHCPLGYTGNGRVCRDVNECLVDNGGCSRWPMVECINIEGSSRCAPCPPGFTGDGYLCTRMSACNLELNGGCHPMAKCYELNAESSTARICVCQYPYTGSGIGDGGCQIQLPQLVNGISPLNDSFSGKNDSQLLFDLCSPNPCLNGATCKIHPITNVECICKNGWQGARCENQVPDCGGYFYGSQGSLVFPTTGSLSALISRLSVSQDNLQDQEDQLIKCNITISVLLTSSIELSFNKFASKNIQLYLANSTSSHHSTAPTCLEFLDIYEYISADDTSRLAARLCNGGSASIETKQVNSTDKTRIRLGSNVARLEYSFIARKLRPSHEASLSFSLNWSETEPPCGGELVAESGSIVSPKFPEFYLAGTECRYFLKASTGKRFRLQFGELNLLTGSKKATSSADCADYLTILDGAIGPDRPVLFKYCANNSTLMARSSSTLPTVLSSGTSLEVIFVSKHDSMPPLMRPHQKRGFYITYATELNPSSCGSIHTLQQDQVKSFDFIEAPVQYMEEENQPGIQIYHSNPEPWRITEYHEPPAQSRTEGKDLPGERRIRCEYQVKIEHSSHKIMIDWLMMPLMVDKERTIYRPVARSKQCRKSSLKVYDGNLSMIGNKSLVANFCAGDTYNASSIDVIPIETVGGLMNFVYETTALDDEQLSENNPGGFKLKYTAVCETALTELSSKFRVELDSQTPECTYNLLLPANQTIHLSVQPSASSIISGLCKVSAYVIDGLYESFDQRANRMVKLMKNLATLRESYGSNDSGDSGEGLANDEMESLSKRIRGGIQSLRQQSRMLVESEIRAFEVCHIPPMSYTSTWNQIAIMFKLQPGSSRPVDLNVEYTSDKGCGGIISHPPEGIIDLSSKMNKSDPQSPLCPWYLRSPNKRDYIRIQIQAPLEQIRSRFDGWLSWTRLYPRKDNQTSNFRCANIFTELIEIYEPILDLKRQICPIELVDNSTDASVWLTQSNVLFVRLLNSSDNRTDTTKWPGIKPLNWSQFKLSYKFVDGHDKTLCGGRILQDSGIIRSPRFPFYYPDNANCTWIIKTAHPDQQIRLNFTSFDLEDGSCQLDYLEIFNGPKSDSPLIGKFCGRQLKSKVITTHSNIVRLHFKSDWADQLKGFEVYYDGLQTGCGGHLRSATGQIDSPNYPYSMGHSAECEWIIEVAQSNTIEVDVLDLELSDTSGSQIQCKPEGLYSSYLAIYDSAVESRQLARFCTKTKMKETSFRSSGNKILIVYRSEALVNSRGFRLVYRTICNSIQLSGIHGAIESPGYPWGYAPNLHCSWMISAPVGNNLSIVLTDLELEKGTHWTPAVRSCLNDYLEVMAVYADGLMPRTQTTTTPSPELVTDRFFPFKLKLAAFLYKNSSSVIARPRNGFVARSFCGRYLSVRENDRQVMLNTNMAFITFESDALVGLRGFRLEWEAKGCGGYFSTSDKMNINFMEPKSTTGKPVECVWILDLSAKYNKIMEIVLDADMQTTDSAKDPCLEGSLTVYDGLDENSTILEQNCHDSRKSLLIISSGPKVMVKFYKNGKHNLGRSFHLRAYLTDHECMTSSFSIRGPMNQVLGEKHSPGYPDQYQSTKYRCFSILDSNLDRLRITITELNIPVDASDSTTGQTLTSDECVKSENYLSIVSSIEKSKIDMSLCGLLDSPREIITERSNAALEFRTSNTGLRGRWSLSYGLLCGASLFVYSSPITLKTPNYPGKPKWLSTVNNDMSRSENVCIWKTIMPTQYDMNLQMKLNLHIEDFVEGTKSGDCIRIFEGVDIEMKQSKFNLTQIDSQFQPKIKICSKSDLGHANLRYISQGSTLLIMTSGDVVAKFKVEQLENRCGAEMRLTSAQFASPDYPSPYTSDLDCQFFIMASPGSKIELKFIDFDLPSGVDLYGTNDVCENVDHIEIRQLNFRDLFVSYLSKVHPPEGQFFYYLYGGSLLVSEKRNTNLSSFEIDERNSTWKPSHLFELSAISILVRDFWNEGDRTRYDRMELGTSDFYQNSQLLGRYCGSKQPDLNRFNLKDILLVRFRSHSPPTETSSSKRRYVPKGFLAEYKYHVGGSITDKEDLSRGGLISSPGYPMSTNQNSSFKWTFVTDQSSILRFQLIHIDLGSLTEECQDMLTIFDGSESDTRITSLCGYLRFKNQENMFKSSIKLKPVFEAYNEDVKKNLIKTFYSKSNTATIIYDNFRSEGRFLLRYMSVPAGKRVPGAYAEYWPSSNDEEQYDNLTSSQNVDINYDKNLDCSHSYKLSLDNLNTTQIELKSPGWPKVPEKPLECHWSISTTDNVVIRLSIQVNELVGVSAGISDEEESLKKNACFLNSGNKKNNFISIYDGSSMLAPLIGKYCLPVTFNHVESSGRQMFIRYVYSGSTSDRSGADEVTNYQGDGIFKGTVSVGQCGGSHRIIYSSKISDRPDGRAKTYGNNLDCRYYLISSDPDQVLSIYSDPGEFNLSSEPTNSDCSVGDYIEFRDLVVDPDRMTFSTSQTGQLLGRYCQGKKFVHLNTPGSGVVILFKTDSSGVSKGWKLSVTNIRSSSGCPRESITFQSEGEQFARIVSPNYPNGLFGNRSCVYHLKAQPGKSLKVTFLSLNRPRYSNGTCMDRLSYLDDNEADIYRYSGSQLSQLNYLIDGTIMRNLVRSLDSNSDKESIGQELLTQLTAKIGTNSKIQPEEYFHLISLAPPNTTEIVTDSHSLLLTYTSKNLQPKEGFYAVVRTISTKFTCGGVVSPKEIDVSSLSSSEVQNKLESPQPIRVSGDLLKSGYLQCEWKLVYEPPRNYYYFDDHKYNAEASWLKYNTIYLVFNMLEIPASVKQVNPDSAYITKSASESAELCGLNRLMISGNIYSSKMYICGNATKASSRWILLNNREDKVSLRTMKNQSTSDQLSNQATQYRGMKAYLFDSECDIVKRLVGGGYRLLSNRHFPNSSYSPGICFAHLNLEPGEYELWFEKINLRLPKKNGGSKDNRSAECNIEDPELDYIELRTSDQDDAAVIARFCANNQPVEGSISRLMENEIKFNELTKTPGREEMKFGFRLQLIHTRNVSSFCDKGHLGVNIYSFIVKKYQDDDDELLEDVIPSGFLYPKNTHCIVDLNLKSGEIFKLWFEGMLDMESSPKCINDYLQIDDLLLGNTTNIPPVKTNPAKTSSSALNLMGNYLMPQPITRVCGKTRPVEYFLSKGSRIRITFHSNERLEGKGFRLVYNVVQQSNKTVSPEVLGFDYNSYDGFVDSDPLIRL